MSAIWQPYWLANTAYTATAVVIPTVFGGYTWRCTTAGTSGGTEPAWPDPTITPTVSDGGVTWSVGTGFRQALQLGGYNVVKAFSAANPTIIRSVRTVRPGSYGTASLPCFFIGDLSESITHANGVRTRTMAGFSAFLVDNLGTIEDSNDRMNFAADALTDLFTLNYHAAGGISIFQQTGSNDSEVADGQGVILPALEFTFAETKLAEGRT